MLRVMKMSDQRNRIIAASRRHQPTTRDKRDIYSAGGVSFVLLVYQNNAIVVVLKNEKWPNRHFYLFAVFLFYLIFTEAGQSFKLHGSRKDELAVIDFDVSLKAQVDNSFI